MASTYDNRPTGDNLPFKAMEAKIGVVEIDLDGADQTIAQNETVSLLNLLAGDIILAAEIQVVTAQADISDVDLGYSTDGSTNDALVDGATLETTGVKFTAGIAAAIPITADSILVFTNKDAQSISTGKVRIVVVIARPTLL